MLQRLTVLLLTMAALSSCSMLYMNAVRENPSEVRIKDGDTRSSLRRRYGRPVKSDELSDTFRLRGKLDRIDERRQMSAMTAFTFGLGEIVVFPYVLAAETADAVLEHFCFRVGYDKEEKAINYSSAYDCERDGSYM